MSSETKPRAVYKLVRTDKPEDGTDVYIGSTSQPLKKRLWCHRHDTKRVNSKLYTRMREVGAENWQILPLVVCPCNHEEIRTFEQQWVEFLKPDLNTHSPLDKNSNINNIRATKERQRISLETKKYYCDVCDKAFRCLGDLKKHLNSEKHKNKNFEQLIEGVHEMVQDGTFSQALENSKETTL